MKLCKALFLLGIFFASTECTSDILTTSHVEQAGLNGRKSIKPKEHFCSETKIQKLKCHQKSSDACKSAGTTSQVAVCGFDHFGVKFDFKRECEICENDNIKYYFKGTCDKTPKICTKTEECVNGLCIQIMNDKEDANRVVCNESQDCPAKSDICIANKCVDKRDLIQKLQRTEAKNPEFAKKIGKGRKEAMKHENERRKKEKDELEQFKNEIKNIKQRNKQNRKSKRLSSGSDSPIASN